MAVAIEVQPLHKVISESILRINRARFSNRRLKRYRSDQHHDGLPHETRFVLPEHPWSGTVCPSQARQVEVIAVRHASIVESKTEFGSETEVPYKVVIEQQSILSLRVPHLVFFIYKSLTEKPKRSRLAFNGPLLIADDSAYDSVPELRPRLEELAFFLPYFAEFVEGLRKDMRIKKSLW